ncbi:TonB-dependent receptor [Psychroserpens sp. XS_ASV72]|uniref:TonB-dependent receptor domain-containing protein n=1 Tax=Psychroserpens sp. XS_ASV72 TaxID=3241293 RepID=UPI0035166BBE
MIICFILLPYLAFSQEEAKFYIGFNSEPLASAFEIIEDTYHVRFSYENTLVSDKTITLKSEQRTLKELLFEIESLFEMSFEVLDNRYIIVNKNKGTPHVQELERIIITSYLTKGISKQKDATFEINPDYLGILPGLTEPDVLESVQLLPGVVSPNETASGFLVRGGKTDQNRLIWDGINMYHKGHLFGMLSPFNPNATKQITFINKGSHPRYGERASSVVNMSTTKTISDSLQTQIGFNGINVDAYVESPIIKEKLGVQASVRSSYTNIYQTYTFDQLADKVFRSTKIQERSNSDNDFSFLDYNFKVNFKPNEKNKVYASVISIDNELDYTVRDQQQTFNDVMRIKNSGYGLEWEKNWSSSLKQHTSAFFSQYELDYNYLTFENDEQISEFEKRNVIYDSGISTEFQYQINPAHALDIGYQYVLKDVGYIFKNTANLEFILDQDDSEIQTHSFFVNYHYKNPRLFDVSFGTRATYFKELDAIRLEPRLVLYKQLFKNIKLQLSGEIKNQVISEIDETIISDLSLENRLWRLANGKEFPIINSKQASLGFIYTNDGWTIDADGYYKKMNNITALSFGFLNPQNSQYNLGERDVLGLDLFLKKRYKSFSSWLSYGYSYSESTYENLNNNNAFTSRSNVLHSISSSVSYKLSNFQIALGWRWQTGKPFTPSVVTNDGFAFNNGINTRRLPDYHRLDFSSTYSFKFSRNNKLKGKVGISIRNIYNQDNLLSREYFGNNDFENDVELIDKFSLGFTPNLMFRLYW